MWFLVVIFVVSFLLWLSTDRWDQFHGEAGFCALVTAVLLVLITTDIMTFDQETPVDSKTKQTAKVEKPKPKPETKRWEAKQVSGSLSLYVYTDPKTECQYLKPQGEAGLTPRLLPDGSQMGCSKSYQAPAQVEENTITIE